MNLLFDLDGTLTDPRRGILACFEYALRRLRVSVPDQATLKSFIGPPLKESFATLLGSDNDARVAEAVAAYRERFATKGLFESRVYSGIPGALCRLRDQGFALFVATSKPTVFARRIVEHCAIGDFFRAVYGSELSGANADKRDLLAHVVRAESLSPAETIMIGDRAHDVQGARANDLFPVGALWGYGLREELLSAGAQWLCQEPSELSAMIPRIRRAQRGEAMESENSL